ncbi:hypothetical protein [Streptomyces sp. NPDC001594]|uniref:hypothetical protein n=1 Tax=Streptomyces sp. NPDC001594 TaxID=3364590 RepID=UPI0036B6438E
MLLLLIAGAAAIAATAPTAAMAAVSSDRGGPITRSEVIWRAQHWMDQHPPYNQKGSATDAGGDFRYRTDCSGYVSMAWHLNANPNTQGLDGHSHEIARDELRAGDILNSFYDHTLIFHKWEDDHGGFSSYSFGGGSSDVEPPGPRVASGRSADGRLEAFAAGADGVYHSWQTAVNGAWSQWRFEGGPRNAQLSVAANADGVFHRWQTSLSAWSGWEGMSGPVNFELASDRSVDGRVEVFAVNGSTAGHNADGRIEVFATSSAGVHHKWQTGFSAWSEWGWVGTSAGPGIA